MTVGPHSTKLPQSWDTESDQLGVPAMYSVQLISSESVSFVRLPQHGTKVSNPDGSTRL